MVCWACSHSPTMPDGTLQLTTALGFHIQADEQFLVGGGVLMPAHGTLADRWWTELMGDLTKAGMAKADPSDTRGYLIIHLRHPIDADGNILFSDGRTPVGSYYDYLASFAAVPGDYPTAKWPGRPSAQPLKHEMLHYWCYRTMGHLCTTGSDPWTNHVWHAPDGTNVWDFTWH